MAGESLASFDLVEEKLNHIAIKEAVFPFNRFPGVDTVLGPEMKSTGEVMGIDTSYAIAFAKSQIGSGSKVPREGVVFVSVRDDDKAAIVDPMRASRARRLQDHRDRRHAALSGRERRCRPSASTRCWRAARISSIR